MDNSIKNGSKKWPTLFLMSLILVILGGSIQSYTHKNIDPLLLGLLIFLLGSLFTTLIYKGQIPEIRVFCLSLGVITIVGGVSQLHSLITFGEIQSFPDATRFQSFIPSSPPYWDKVDLIPQLNAVYPVLIWQQIYIWTSNIGLSYGPYIGIMFNSLLVAISGSLTVNAARFIFGDNSKKLIRIGVLFSFCGMLWLFGAILIRDCFALLINALFLWAILKALNQKSVSSVTIAATLSILASLTMFYVRPHATVMFGMIILLAILFWFMDIKNTVLKIVFSMFILVSLLIIFPFVQSYSIKTFDYAVWEQEAYSSIAKDSSSLDSIGLALVQEQPMPVRAVMGTARLMIDPIPFWFFLKPGVNAYELLKTYHFFYFFYLTPFIILGCYQILYNYFRRGSRNYVVVFLLTYTLFTILAVALTSLENRHLGQFMPAMVMIATIPDPKIKSTRDKLFIVGAIWIGIVILAYLAWLSLKYF